MNCHCCSGKCRKSGSYRNRNRIVQRYTCDRCAKSFSESQPLDGLRVDFEKACQVVHLLVEGMGIRACERLTGLNRRTVLEILATAGEKAARVLDEKIRDVQTESVQCDELYSFVHCLERNNEFHADDVGEMYTYLGIDRQSKLILSHLTGKRDDKNTDIFMADLRKRVKGTCQLTSDAFKGYRSAVANAFGRNVHFAQQAKIYANAFPMPKKLRRLLKPEGCVGVKTYVRIGNPDRSLITTSHVERTNLSVRIFTRRFVRRMIGYSKKLDNLRHAVALFIFHFNFCRNHSALRIKATETTKAQARTPAMAAKIENHQWTIEEMLKSAI